MNEKNKVILSTLVIGSVFAVAGYQLLDFNKVSIKNVEKSHCVEIANNVDIKVYKKYGDKPMANHPDFIERELNGNSQEYHSKYNYYKINNIVKDYMILSNQYDQDFQIKIPNKKSNILFKECVNQNLNYVVGSCLEYTNLRTGNKSFWQIQKLKEDEYFVSGIYNSHLTNKIVQDGQLNKLFKHYNPDLSYPIKVGKFQINQSSKVATCPQSIKPKFKEKDCLKFNDLKLKITSILLDSGVYETKILGQSSASSRTPASLSENLDSIMSNIEKEKIKHGWKDLYFMEQDQAELTECK